MKSAGKGLRGMRYNAGGDILGSYSNMTRDIVKSAAINHVFDYYLKMYVESTIGLDFKECNFPLDSKKLYTGELNENRYTSDLYFEYMNFIK